MRRVLIAVLFLVLAVPGWPSPTEAARPVDVGPACPTPESGDTLKIGHHGQRVLSMQTRMNWWNDKQDRPRILVDGCFGRATKQAVEGFQRDKGLIVDGKYGPNTKAAMEGGSSVRTAPPRASSPPPTTAPPKKVQKPSRVWTGCSLGGAWAKLLVCLDVGRQQFRIYDVDGNQIDELLLGSSPVTTSRRITNSRDTITRKGFHWIFSCAKRTPKLRLRQACFFNGEQAFHQYPIVGGRADSNGCGRQTWWGNDRMWSIFRSYGIIGPDGYVYDTRAIRVHIY